ncbi:LytS/YhcK type 5TM receptor domain-containing protein [Gelria sp. Kuro-4]|uniref:LytS/YhcK type 5TM receptor domain-containing protein n=1 Tax=Gelria sp. Kuro-4 TaxID=2796927 RepID=UPI001BF031CD|nr:LytS/YhcK type 5TM receptor domain-containing protein [Gelria sp. Kuro-4]BCV25586.1 sensor protein LytS [Gelria sp. Kuro-4]
MLLSISLSLLRSIAVIALAAYLGGRTPFLWQLLAGQRKDLRARAVAILFFGLLSMAGTNLGILINGAIANSRSIGVVVGGLLAGSWVGLVAGVLSGTHRYFLGGFTAVPCAISPVVGGLIGGCFYRRNRGRLPTPGQGAAAAFLAELIQRFLVLGLAKPFSLALHWELLLGGPMLLVNSLGAAVFVLMIRDMHRQLETNAATHIGLVMDVANRALPWLAQGLTAVSAARVAQELRRLTGVAMAGLLDAQGAVLAVDPPELKDGFPRAVPVTGGPAILTAAIAFEKQTYGYLRLVEKEGNQITRTQSEVALGMSGLLARELRIVELEHLASLHTQMQLQLLQAQVNPHFLFNALSTIIALCRKDAQQARELLTHLAHFLRKTLTPTSLLVSLGEELETVEAYLLLEQARFGERLQTKILIDPEAAEVAVPSFLLQPLVENAVRHGLLPRSGPGHLTLELHRTPDGVWMRLEDDGVGIPPERLAGLLRRPRNAGRGGLGLYNVNERLRQLYGEEYELTIRSQLGKGTTVTLYLPAWFRPGQTVDELLVKGAG